MENRYTPTRIGIGTASFKDYLQEKNYFIDKTLFIKRFLINATEVFFQVINRSRRSGKTITLTMLYTFLSDKINDKPNPYKEAFKNFEIGQSEHEDFVQTHFAQYKIIHLTLKDTPGDKLSSAFYNLAFEMSKKFREYAEVENKLNLKDKEKFKKICVGELSVDSEEDKNMILQSLPLLSSILAKHYNKKTIILIDEFDTPLIKAQNNSDSYNFISSFILSLTEMINSKILLIGITNPLHQELSVLPYYKMYSALKDDQYASDFGITDKEMEQLIQWRISVKDTTSIPEDILNKFKQFYGGYQFGYNQQYVEVHQLWSVINCIVNFTFENSWTSSGSTNYLDKLFTKYKNQDYDTFKQLRKQFENLIADKKIQVDLNPDWTFSQLESSIDTFWSFMANTGYVTLNHCDNSSHILIPNKEIMNSIKSLYEQWFRPFSQNKDNVLECLLYLNSTDLKFKPKGLEQFKSWLKVERDALENHADELKSCLQALSFDQYQSFIEMLCKSQFVEQREFCLTLLIENLEKNPDLFISYKPYLQAFLTDDDVGIQKNSEWILTSRLHDKVNLPKFDFANNLSYFKPATEKRITISQDRVDAMSPLYTLGGGK